MNDGLKGWSSFGDSKLEHRESPLLSRNNYIATHNRNQSNDSLTQKLYLDKNYLYTFSAWVQVSNGSNVTVRAGFETSSGLKLFAGSTVAESNCWTMLKGGLTVDESGPAQLYFESNNTAVEIWIDSVSLQPFTENEWKFHQHQSIEKEHKKKVRIQVVDSQGQPLANTTISVQLKRPSFPFGSAINYNILTNTAYQNWLTSRPFTVTTFENEMKWYTTEKSQGNLDYSASDALLQFTKRHRIDVRAHNVFWDDPNYQPNWLNSLSRNQLALATYRRLRSIMMRYKGQVIAWDVVNENLHFDYFERRVSRNASGIFYRWGNEADQTTPLFMNEFNTIESSGDTTSSPWRYIKKLRQIKKFSSNIINMKMGIGVEGHFSANKPNIPYMRAAIDTLAAARLPIWITELDVQSTPNQAWYLEEILREARSHPHVNGIVLWTAWRPQGCYRMCLTDNNFNNLPTGDVVDKLMREWGRYKETTSFGTTDAHGFFETSLFHGYYHLNVHTKHSHNLGHGLYASPYNYYATTKCLKEPQKALYGGGVIVNPEFNHNNSQGWVMFGKGKIEQRLSKEGNKFIVAHNPTHPLHSFSHQVQVENGKIYSFSAWIQVSEGSEDVTVVFKSNKGYLIHGGTTTANSGCWTLLKGGMVANFSGPLDISFETKNTSVEIWVDSVSLQPFTQKQWRSQQEKSINKVRRSKVRIQVSDENRTLLQGAVVSIKQKKPGFLFGCCMNHNILTSTQYQNWFSSRFHATTFTNEMKWYSTENVQGQENYSTADAMVEFAQKHGISIRGHNIFWDDPIYQPYWVRSLSPDELRKAAAKRINSVVSKYRGKVIGWDVMNENMHFNFFEDKLGKTASADYYKIAQQLDPQTTMFLNEYNTIEYSGDTAVTPAKYLNKIREILSYPGNAHLKLGIGLEGHFTADQPNLAYMRSALDILGATKFPIWLTEISVANSPNEAKYLEEVLREGYAHPAVQGIIMFTGPVSAGFNTPILADQNFKNTPSGDVVDKLLKEWNSGADQDTITDSQGFIDVTLSHGDYDLTIKHPFTNSSSTLSLRVEKDKPLGIIHVNIDT
ncbi:hypothetical protein G4B88_011281 [Cannabis sativa]|uniref:GH10 domain-containing protein n=1 Tax=Cannabis sativa TaxID=3483 RepID=A0A7J6GJJ0_CANSA|nr:hypothetical protein G4B88_011281 [Cannabis sativa]